MFRNFFFQFPNYKLYPFTIKKKFVSLLVVILIHNCSYCIDIQQKKLNNKENQAPNKL